MVSRKQSKHLLLMETKVGTALRGDTHVIKRNAFTTVMKAAHAAAQVMKHMRPTDNAKPAAVFQKKKHHIECLDLRSNTSVCVS